MKHFSIFAVLSMLLLGCTDYQEQDSKPVAGDVEFIAGFEDDETSRTYVENGRFLRWTADDRISIFNANTYNAEFRFMGETGDNSGAFTNVRSDAFVTGNNIDYYCAVYPYHETTSLDDDSGEIFVTLPAEQAYAENSFGVGGNTMIAVTKDKADRYLLFKNVCGYLKLQLYGSATIKRITLEGNNSEKISGAATVSAAYNVEPEVVMSDDAGEKITLTCGEGVVLSDDAEKPTIFWLVVPATTFEKGVTVIVEDVVGNSMGQYTDKEIVIERNTIQPMAALEFEEKIAANQIRYTSSDGEIVAPNATDVFGANIVSNTYDKDAGYGTITFDGKVTSIGYCAFYGCTSLTSITIPDSVTSIGDDAFCYCSSLTSVTIPDSVTSIGYYAFYNCTSLTSITIPDSVTSIGGVAFAGCTSLTNVTIPDSVTSIGDSAFGDCTSLIAFYGKFTSEDNRCLIVDGVLNSFAPTGITTYTIPDSVTSIGNYAFWDCTSLTSITIPDGVTSIGSHAFYNCTSLTSITIPDSVTSIESYAFWDCTSLTSVTIPDSVTSIGNGAFRSCRSLTAFYGKFTSEDNRCLIVDGVLNSFAPTGITTYTIPDSVTSIGGGAFGSCTSLTNITIPDSVTSIGYDAFSYCTSLTSVTIPDSVTSIGYCAFYGCTSLTSVYCKPTTPPMAGGSYIFDNNASGRKIYVPTASVSAYKAASGWSDYASYIEEYHEFVDLGLSVKWATCNLGATEKGDAGNYYMWGDIVNRKSEGYSADNYPYLVKTLVPATDKDGNPMLDEETGEPIMTEVWNYTDIGANISGNEQYDVARKEWGATWRIPTQEEVQELIANCTFVWTNYKSATGFEITSKINGMKIYMPAVGYYMGNATCSYFGSNGSYWTASAYTGEKTGNAYYILMTSGRGFRLDYTAYHSSHPIRPVME